MEEKRRKGVSWQQKAVDGSYSVIDLGRRMNDDLGSDGDSKSASESDQAA